MRLGFEIFSAISLSAWLGIAFILAYLDNRRCLKIKKSIDLKRRQCEVCTAVYFVSVASEFWRCPRCDSINKEK